MNFNLAEIRSLLNRPAAALAGGLVLVGVLAVLPSALTNRMRDAVAVCLRPGQLGVSELRHAAAGLRDRANGHLQTADQLTEAQQRIDQLERENRRLRIELEVGRKQLENFDDDRSDRLLSARLLPARVLGSQARAFLQRRGMLDVGSNRGVETGGLVLDLPPVIDQGEDSAVAAGQTVLSGRRVFGKIVQVGPNTSTVLGVTESGYRDLVALAGGARGIIEGTGEPLARIRLIDVTEPISEGEAVFSAAGKGALPAAPLYGHVVRFERAVGAAHWEIWMQPAGVGDDPESVGVLQMELNRPLVAEGESVKR